VTMGKLTASVAAGLLSALALGGVGLISFGAFRDLFEDTTQIAVRTIVLADEIGTANAEMVRAQRGVIVAGFGKDAAQEDRCRTDFDHNAVVVQKAVAQIRPLARDVETRRLAAEISGLEAEWLPHYRELVAETQAGNLAEANHIRRDVTAPIYQRISAAVQQIAVLSRGTLRAEQQTNGIFFRSRSLPFFLLALTLLVGGLATAVLRSIRQELRRRRQTRLITSGSANWPRHGARSQGGEKKWPKLSA
jgi:hypothetical protein